MSTDQNLKKNYQKQLDISPCPSHCTNQMLNHALNTHRYQQFLLPDIERKPTFGSFSPCLHSITFVLSALINGSLTFC